MSSNDEEDRRVREYTERTPKGRHRAMVQKNSKELARPLAAAATPHIPHHEFEEAIVALRAAGYYKNADMSAFEVVTIVLAAAAKVRK